MIGTLSRLQAETVLVIGDFMLDVYTKGKVSRLSPEAPVPILRAEEVTYLPGGAGNVALNLQALGARALPVGRIGRDHASTTLRKLLEQRSLVVEGLIVEEGWQTPVKNRFVADAQHLMRVDEERITPLLAATEEHILAFVANQRGKVKALAISDYAKGFFSHSLLKKLIEMGHLWGVPILVDPKGDDFTKYSGATLITPNVTEAYAAAQVSREVSLDQVGEKLLELSRAKWITITRSEKGMTLFERYKDPVELEAKAREVKDVTGAGDTVLAVAAMTLASRIPLAEGLYVANIAAGLAVEQAGCARIGLAEIAERLLAVHLVDKVFDEEHLFALEQILEKKKLTILALSSKGGVSITLFKEVRRIAKTTSHERLLVYITDAHPDADFTALLSSLHEVDFIVLQSTSLAALCERICPEKVFTLEEDRLKRCSWPAALF